ncbi:MAG: serine hydrolase [Cyclobacteriaceae bacterium]
MKFLQILLICFAWSVSGQSYDEAILKADSMTRRYANQIFNKAGVVGVFYAGKDTIMAHGRINGLGRKADKDDVFQIGSVSKTITGLMFARALEEGWFQLDDSIAPFLDIKEKHRSKFDSVTFRQVVTHTAGLPNNTLDVLGPTFVAGAGVGIIKNQLILAPLGAPALVIYLPWHAAFVPPLPHFATYGRGSRRTDLHFTKLKKHKEFKYSNVGFGVLGNILARHHDTNFEGLLQQEFCEPLGLKETSTQPKNLPKGSYATPHDFFGIRTVRTQFAEWGMEGAGDIKMSAKDLMVYLRMQFDNDHPMSSAVQFQQETLFEQDHPKHPEVAAVGIGWLKDIEEDGTEILWHHDHLLGSSAFIGFLPEKQIGIFILANNAKDRKLTKLGFWWLREQL